VLEVGHRETQEEIKEFMASNGYIFRKYIEIPFASDLLFTHESKTELPLQFGESESSISP